jgi:hypothetical protein
MLSVNLSRLGAVVFLSLVFVREGFARPRAPVNVRAERQDFQAARITWDRMEKNMRYRLYAAHAVEPFDFHQENSGVPIAETFAIWDAPRKEPRRFVFYVTAVDPAGQESRPSKRVWIDLGPLPRLESNP